jgi:hypothetical protein
MTTPPQTAGPPEKDPLITPEADRELFKILIVFIGITIVLFLVTPFITLLANQPGKPLWPLHRIIDFISVIIILTPFLFGINKMSDTRMKFARKYAAEGNWRAVYGAVESFSQIGQRFLDSTGEAHYWLALAYENSGERTKAEKTRQFVIKHRGSSEWAQKLRDFEESRAPKKISDIRAKREETGKKLTKTRRRF